MALLVTDQGEIDSLRTLLNATHKIPRNLVLKLYTSDTTPAESDVPSATAGSEKYYEPYDATNNLGYGAAPTTGYPLCVDNRTEEDQNFGQQYGILLNGNRWSIATTVNPVATTTFSGTDATYTNVNANNVYSPYIAGQTGGNPAGAGVLYVQNAQVGSKLWLSGTAAGEGLRANVGIITYFGHNAKNVLGNLDSNGNNMHINAGSDGIVQASQFRSTIAQGAAPFTVVSTTKVTNLNVDLLDNKSATSAATPDTIMSRNSSANTAVNKLTSATIDNSGNIETNTLDASTADITTLNVTGSINGNSNYPLIDQFRMGKYLETFNDLGNKSGTVNLNTSTANNFRIRLTGNTTVNFTSVPVDGNNSSSDIYSTQIIVKNGTGGASLTWNGNIKWPGGSTPSRTTANGAEDIWVFISYDGGSNWYGNLALPDMK